MTITASRAREAADEKEGALDEVQGGAGCRGTYLELMFASLRLRRWIEEIDCENLICDVSSKNILPLCGFGIGVDASSVMTISQLADDAPFCCGCEELDDGNLIDFVPVLR